MTQWEYIRVRVNVQIRTEVHKAQKMKQRLEEHFSRIAGRQMQLRVDGPCISGWHHFADEMDLMNALGMDGWEVVTLRDGEWFFKRCIEAE